MRVIPSLLLQNCFQQASFALYARLGFHPAVSHVQSSPYSPDLPMELGSNLLGAFENASCLCFVLWPIRLPFSDLVASRTWPAAYDQTRCAPSGAVKILKRIQQGSFSVEHHCGRQLLSVTTRPSFHQMCIKLLETVISTVPAMNPKHLRDCTYQLEIHQPTAHLAEASWP